MQPPTTYLFLLALASALRVGAQSTSLADIQGSWFFHQHFYDSVLIADADKPTPFPTRDFQVMKKAASAFPNAPVPDSAAFAVTLRQNDENYRQYLLEYSADSTYRTELAPGMSKWLPVNGRLIRSVPEGTLQMMDASDMVVTTALKIVDGELHITLTDPTVVKSGTPKLHRELVFRRQRP